MIKGFIQPFKIYYKVFFIITEDIYIINHKVFFFILTMFVFPLSIFHLIALYYTFKLIFKKQEPIKYNYDVDPFEKLYIID